MTGDSRDFQENQRRPPRCRFWIVIPARGMTLYTPYKGMISTALTKKWINDMPDDIIEDLIQNLGLAHQGIRDTPIGSIAEKDFEKVTSWLSYLKNLKRLKKDQPKIYDSYFPSF